MSKHEREIRHADGRIEHPDAPFEGKDIYFGCILSLVIVTGCIFGIVFVVDWYFYGTEGQRQAASKESPYPLPPGGTSSLPLPPPPRLEQIDRMEDRPGESYRDKQLEMERQLHGRGPAAEKGFVHIPIERAMKEIVNQLPVRTPSPDEAKPVHAGSSNSGRMLPGAPPWSDY